MQEIRKKAKELMQGFCRVCPVCNGVVCRGEVPGMGGLSTAASFQNNVTALAQYPLAMRLIHGVVDPKLQTSLWGQALAIPVFAAPIGGVSFNMGGGMTEEDYTLAVVGGSKDAGALGCTGDGVPEMIYKAGFSAITQHKQGIAFIKPWEGQELDTKLEGALALGTGMVGMDIDAAGLLTLRKMGRPVAPKNIHELTKIVAKVHAAKAKFILKGIMTVSDAQKARDAGVDAILVSNHGGRVLDHCPGTAEVLPRIAASLKGQMVIMVDGGVRTGADVFKMLALGADLVGIGRPISIAALGGGQAGVAKYLEEIAAQLRHTMVMTGCAKIEDITTEAFYNE